ncbi:MAG: SDR family oxidoreductase [Clostridia bacterium]|nr:SDR family oxidoreductase [Clostridia bacterium]
MKTALITGASGAIGKAIAKTFLEKGYFVIAQYNSDIDGINSLKNYALEKGFLDYLFTVQADFNDSASIEEMLSIVNKSFKRIDVLVNNAGIDLYKLVTDTSDLEFDTAFSVNVKSAFKITKALLPAMISKGQGNVIFISSILGEKGGSMETVYSLTKSALIGFSKALSKEVGISGVRVNCVCPGVIDTPMNSRFTKEEMQDLIERTALNRVGTPEEVASVVYFLASDDASFITGQTITVDGNFTV